MVFKVTSNLFSDQIVLLKFQDFQSNLLQLSNYLRKRNKHLRKLSFDMLPLRNDKFFVEKLGQKNLKFFKIPLLEWLY